MVMLGFISELVIIVVVFGGLLGLCAIVCSEKSATPGGAG